MTPAEWVQRALDAADEQFGDIAIEDEQVLDVVANALRIDHEQGVASRLSAEH